MENKRTEVAALGEFGLIDYLTKNNEIRRSSTVLGVGDDAAIIDNFGRQTVVSTDMLIEGVHFDLSYMPLKHLGYKAVSVNVSDICAMNAETTQITVSIGISNRFSVEALKELYDGIYYACEHYHIDMVGGDTVSNPHGLVISITAIGEVKPDNFISRSGAQKGDLICVSGDLGGAYLGLQILEREKKIFMESKGVQPDLENRAYVIGRLLKPEARLDIIDWLQKQEITPTAMIDVSDGLSSELLHICTQSRLGCVLYEDKIPFHEETKQVAYQFNIDPTACALSGGEDYELLFTLPQSEYDKIVLSEQISVIGYMAEVEKGTKIITKSGHEHDLTAQGWVAFQKQS